MSETLTVTDSSGTQKIKMHNIGVEASVRVGETCELGERTALRRNGLSEITYRSMDPEIVTVDGAGLEKGAFADCDQRLIVVTGDASRIADGAFDREVLIVDSLA